MAIIDARIPWTAIHPKMGTPELPWPAKKSDQAAGYDCCAAIDEPIEVWAGRLVKVPLGFALALPEGFEAQIRPRSGLAAKGLTMPNSPGTIDADYRGEVSGLLFYGMQLDVPNPEYPKRFHFDPKRIVINPGDRIAQMVICQLPAIEFEQVGQLDATARGKGGFGSTGVSG